jgi:hypothetical protein
MDEGGTEARGPSKGEKREESADTLYSVNGFLASCACHSFFSSSVIPTGRRCSESLWAECSRRPNQTSGSPQLTNVVRLELVHADEDADGREPEGPVGDLSEHRELARVQVVGQDVVKALLRAGSTGIQ